MDELGAGEELPLFLPHHRSWHRQARSRGRITPSFCSLLGTIYSFFGQAWAEAKGSLQRTATARTADRKRTVDNLPMI